MEKFEFDKVELEEVELDEVELDEVELELGVENLKEEGRVSRLERQATKLKDIARYQSGSYYRGIRWRD